MATGITPAAPKSKTGLIIIIAVAVIVIGIVVWYFFFKGSGCDPSKNGYTLKGKYDPKCKVDDPKTTNTPAPQGSSGWVSDSNFPIKRGSWGPKVKALQEKLGVGADGRFGPITEGALKSKYNKTEIATQAEYDAIVSPKPKTPASEGGKNFEDLKAQLGASAKPTTDGSGVYIVAQGENTKYSANFYGTGRMSINNYTTKKIYHGAFKDGGREIVIDSKDGGYSTGTLISNNNVYESVQNIIDKIEGK